MAVVILLRFANLADRSGLMFGDGYLVHGRCRESFPSIPHPSRFCDIWLVFGQLGRKCLIKFAPLSKAIWLMPFVANHLVASQLVASNRVNGIEWALILLYLPVAFKD